MTHRRGRHGDRNGKPAPRRRNQREPVRRVPPPPGTGQESRFLQRRKESGDDVIVTLLNGAIVRGTLSWFDGDLIGLKPIDRAELVLRKSEIRTIEEVHDH